MYLRHKLSGWLVLATLGLAIFGIACDGQGQPAMPTSTVSDVPSPTSGRADALPSPTPTSVPIPDPEEGPATPTPTKGQPTPITPPTDTPIPPPTSAPTPSPTAVPSPTPKPTESPTATLELLLTPTSPPDPTEAPTPAAEPTQPPTSPSDPTEAPTPAPGPTDAPTAIPSPTKAATPKPEVTRAPIPAPEPTAAPTPAPEPTQAPTLEPEPTEEPTPEPTEVPSTSSDVRIVCILFDGEVPRSEADEYVEISNHGGAQDLAGWVLKDRDDRRQEFTFPAYSLGPGDTIRVYTNQVHPRWGGFSFGSGTSLWNNSDADVAVLIDAEGRVVSSATYNTSNPPGCGR